MRVGKVLRGKILKSMVEYGYSENDADRLKDFIDLYETIQFKETIDNEYSIWDYDNWMDIQRSMGIVLDYKTAMNVIHALNREDITVAELPDNKKEITEEMVIEYYESDREYYDNL